MGDPWKAPFLPYDKIREYALDFLYRYHPDYTIPIPIEEIIEFQLGMDIIPIPGLQKEIGCEGFLTGDLRSIYVDQGVMEHNEYRYRFTIAHEVGHSFLHRDLYREASFDSIDGWKRFQRDLDSNQYSWFEKHAYDFAGLVLVPSDLLEKNYAKSLARLRETGYTINPNDLSLVLSYVSSYLSKQFRVSASVIEKRIGYDNLNP
jgi:Zn-dependent peptidase ImmA (M78 family)